MKTGQVRCHLSVFSRRDHAVAADAEPLTALERAGRSLKLTPRCTVPICNGSMGLIEALLRRFRKPPKEVEASVERPASPLTILNELPDSSPDPSQEEVDAFQRDGGQFPWTRI